MTGNGYEVSFGGDKNVLHLAVVMDVQLCEYTASQGIVHFKWINYMVCELYLHKTANKRKWLK